MAEHPESLAWHVTAAVTRGIHKERREVGPARVAGPTSTGACCGRVGRARELDTRWTPSPCPFPRTSQARKSQGWLMANPVRIRALSQVRAACFPFIDEVRIERCVGFAAVEASQGADVRERRVQAPAARKAVRLIRVGNGARRRCGFCSSDSLEISVVRSRARRTSG